MGGQHTISEHVLSEMNNFLNNEKCIGRVASKDDMLFIADGTWLKDAAVFDVIRHRHGAWDVYLLFAHYKNPMQFIVRKITRCFSEMKAKASAFYLRKEAAKDRRGTLNVSIEDLNLCSN